MTDSVLRRTARRALLASYGAAYAYGVRPLMFRAGAPTAHERLLAWLRWLDAPRLQPALGALGRLAQLDRPVSVGGVTLASPLILAAGLVKGEGFDSEAVALDAAKRGVNIIPGWRGLPRLAGLVEFGSFTRWPRLGNPGTVVWRDVATRSTQNRIGLRNPGARAAAWFLGARRAELPTQFGINIAVSPGVTDAATQTAEVLEALGFFLEEGVFPTWFTLNLSCPNTEDDPRGHQTADEARLICAAAVARLNASADQAGRALPLWGKLGPNLNDAQYASLIEVFAETGVRAVVATNTMPESTPDGDGVAGVGGGRLHARALAVVQTLARTQQQGDLPVDIVGCGGVLDGHTLRAYQACGARAVEYWSALVFRGPLAAALIAAEGNA